MSRMTNADVLKELNVTVPDDGFDCAITYEVIDDPVIDPYTLNSTALAWLAASPEEKAILDCGNFKEIPRYDRSTLVRLIKPDSTGISPNTRLLFTEQQLIPDTELKSKIDFFMHPHRETVERSATKEKEQRAFSYIGSFFSQGPQGAAIELESLLKAALNAVEDLKTIQDIVENTSPAQLPILLSTSSTAAIEHLKHLNIQRTGTPLQMALYSDDEDVVAYLKTVMDPEEFERQSKKAFRNALPPSIQAELDTRAAPALEYYNAMLIVQKTEAEKLCNAAFQFDAANNRFTVTNATATDFQQKLTDYLRNNPIHNPFILHRLYEIYGKLPDIYAEDCLFSQRAIGLANTLSSARWLQHYAQGIYYLGGGNGMPKIARRSFVCCDSNPAVDVRSFIPASFGVDSCMSIIGYRRRWRVPIIAAIVRTAVWPLLGNFCRTKTANFQNLLRCQYEHAPASLSVAAA